MNLRLPPIKMEPEWEFWIKTLLDPAIFWLALTAIATVSLVVATIALVWIGLIPLVRSKKAELAERFREELLSPPAQTIFFLAAHGFLKFALYKRADGSEIPYFEIIKPTENIMLERLSQIFGNQRIVMTFEMDDRLLAPLDELAYYEKRGEIEFEDAYRIFADYIDVCWRNKELVEYVEWARKHLKPDLYANMEELHKKIRDHYEALRRQRV